MGYKSGCMENMVGATLNTFYLNKKIFLTGHTGFKGSWMLAWLNSMNAIVKGYALPPKNINDIYNIIGGNSICDSVYADIRDKDKIKKELIAFQPDIIFHFAAQPLVRASYDEPLTTFETNAMGTANLLDALRDLNKKCSVLIITTDKVYRNQETTHIYSEEDRLGGHDPYSASKAAAELITDSYQNSFFNLSNYSLHQKAIATCRSGNVIGGGDWSKDRIIPDIIQALVKGEKINVRNPNATRPWQHVLEPISAYLLLAKNLPENATAFSGAWNFGPTANDNLTVKNIVEVAIKSWGSGSYETLSLKNQPHEATLLQLNINKAITKLGWKPRYTPIEAVENTIAWYKQAPAKQKEFTYTQLNNFRT